MLITGAAQREIFGNICPCFSHERNVYWKHKEKSNTTVMEIRRFSYEYNEAP